MKKGKNSCTLLAFVSGRLELCSVYSWSELGGVSSVESVACTDVQPGVLAF